MSFSRLAAAGLLLSATVPAQFDAVEYMPLGAFSAWEMVDAEAFNDFGLIEGAQLLSVTKVLVVDEQPQYNVRTKIFSDVKDILFTFGVEGGALYLYGARVTAGEIDNDLSIPKMTWNPPVFCGDASTVLGDSYATQISAQVEVSLKVSSKKIKGDVDVTGTVTASWQAVADIDTPLGTFDGNDLAQLTLGFELDYSSDDDDIDDELAGEHTSKTVRGVMGRDVGFVRIDGAGSTQKILNRAILPGSALGEFPELPVDLVMAEVPTPGLFTLEGATDATVTDGFVTLSEIAVEHRLGGKLLMTGMVDVVGAAEDAAVPVTFTGKMKFAKSGGAKVTLKGKLTHPALLKPLNMKVKQVMTAKDTSILIAYKAGKDTEGNPVAGTLDLQAAPAVIDQVTLVMSYGMADVGFDTKSKRKLGAEGVLDMGALSKPVILKETLKSKEGQPDKRSYQLIPTGGKLKLLKFTATSTSALDYALLKLKGKLLGYKIAPTDLGDVTLSVE